MGLWRDICGHLSTDILAQETSESFRKAPIFLFFIFIFFHLCISYIKVRIVCAYQSLSKNAAFLPAAHSLLTNQTQPTTAKKNTRPHEPKRDTRHFPTTFTPPGIQMEDGEIMYAPAHLQRDADLKDSAIGCIRDNADMEGNSTIASAVVIPEHDADPSTSPSERLKRRQAEEPGTEALKRQRLSDVGAGAGAESETRENRRQKRMEEEKKRGKRLFGALLGTIGQFQKETTTRGARAAQVKRREVEAKLHEKMKAQTEEIDERRKREDDVVNLRRRVESRDFEERAVRNVDRRARGRGMLTTVDAHTACEPASAGECVSYY